MQKFELLSTIESLFWENAFSDLSMDMIAEKLGIKKPSLYYHFPSKEAMFLAVLEQSVERYQIFLEQTLQIQDIDHMISELILFPLREKNLFAIVSQKGYCQIDEIREFIQSKNREFEERRESIFQGRYGWSKARTNIFCSLVEGLSKRACLEHCEGEKKEEMIGEIRKLFFTA